jgi:hypothetical protein
MFEIARSDGLLCLRAVLLALLGALVLAASASAEPVAGAEGAPETQEGGGASQTESQSPPTGESGSEGTPEGSQGPLEGITEVTTPPASETPELPIEVPTPPAGETPVETPVTLPTEGATDETPTGILSVGGEEAQPKVPTGEVAEEVRSTKLLGEGSEETTGGSGTLPSRSTPADPTATTASTGSSASIHVDAAALEAPNVPPGGPPAMTSAVTAQIAQVSGLRDEESTAAKHSGTMVAKQAGRFSCELSALSGSMTDNCTVGWLGTPRIVASASTTGSAALRVSSLILAVAATSPPDGGHGGTAVGGPPIAPAPGPAPSGASGVASGGASGIGLSTFLSLAGLLLLGAPRALRRLRLSCEPWLAGCFVLIPERPD